MSTDTAPQGPDVENFTAFMAWMDQVGQDSITQDVPPEIHWRSMARILALVSGRSQVDWQELRDDREQVLRRVFTRPGEPHAGEQGADVMQP
jgi:hypothetical protein